MLIEDGLGDCLAQGWPYGPGICSVYTYSIIYNSYTAAGESVPGAWSFFLGGVTTKRQYVPASPVAGTDLSLFIVLVFFRCTMEARFTDTCVFG